MTQQDFQRKVGMLNEKYRKQFQNQQSKFFNETVPAISKHPDMVHYRKFAMIHVSEATENLAYGYWESLLTSSDDTLTITDIVTILKAAEPRTMKDWLTTFPAPQGKFELALAEWRSFRQYIALVSTEVNPIIDKYTTELLDKLLRTQSLDITGQSHSIPATHKNPLLAKQ